MDPASLDGPLLSGWGYGALLLAPVMGCGVRGSARRVPERVPVPAHPRELPAWPSPREVAAVAPGLHGSCHGSSQGQGRPIHHCPPHPCLRVPSTGTAEAWLPALFFSFLAALCQNVAAEELRGESHLGSRSPGKTATCL